MNISQDAVFKVVALLLDEAVRVKKIPWTCDSTIQAELRNRANEIGVVEEESMAETIARREHEDHST